MTDDPTRFYSQTANAQLWAQQREEEQKKRTAQLEARMHQAEERIRLLEAHIHYPNQVIADKMTQLKEDAARTVSMRSDVATIMDLRAFVERIATGGDLSYCTTAIINVMADVALGRRK